MPQPAGSPVPYRRASQWGEYARFWDEHRWSCQPPPWGTLNAVDLNKGEIVWRVPLGVVDELAAQGVPKTGAPNLGGSLVTAGGLVFIAGSNDSRFRAFDARTEEELWVTKLEASGHAHDVRGEERREAIRRDCRRWLRLLQPDRLGCSGRLCLAEVARLLGGSASLYGETRWGIMPAKPSITTSTAELSHNFRTTEYFTLAFGSMVGVGWLVVIDDWLRRGGPLGAMLGFLIGGLVLLPIGYTYGKMVLRIRDAGSEIAYTSAVFSPTVSFLTGWMMTLAYLIVCPWEAVAIGRILSYVFPSLNALELYRVAGKPVFLPHLLLGLFITAWIVWLNYRGIHLSGFFQNVTTFGLLAVFALIGVVGLSRGTLRNMNPPFNEPGAGGAVRSVLLVLQIVPYFMTGFESVPKCCEEARPGFDPRGFVRAIFLAIFVGCFFYVGILGVVSLIYPWRLLTSSPFGTAVAFERAFHWPWLVDIIMVGAVLSLLKIFNGNFLAASRLVFALGRRELLHPRLSIVHSRYHTPTNTVLLCGLFTALCALFGEALLIPVIEVGSMASAVGWFATCLAFMYGAGRTASSRSRRVEAMIASAGACVSLGLILMKFLPSVPGHFSRYEYTAMAFWILLGLLLWRRRATPQSPAPATRQRHTGNKGNE